MKKKLKAEDYFLEVNPEPGYSYLASPYSAKNVTSEKQAIVIRARRYKTVCKMAGKLMKEGHKIFCPIAHSHPIEVIGMPGQVNDFDFWMKQDLPVLDKAKEVLVYQMSGWEESRGVTREIERARELGIPIRYIPNVSWQKYEMKADDPRKARSFGIKSGY